MGVFPSRRTTSNLHLINDKHLAVNEHQACVDCGPIQYNAYTYIHNKGIEGNKALFTMSNPAARVTVSLVHKLSDTFLRHTFLFPHSHIHIYAVHQNKCNMSYISTDKMT